MALDATITHIEEDGYDLILTLEARDIKSGPAGQPKIRIQYFTVKPCIGDQLWSTGTKAQIESQGISFPYVRSGYGTLLQDWTSQAEIDKIIQHVESGDMSIPENLPTADEIIVMERERIANPPPQSPPSARPPVSSEAG